MEQKSFVKRTIVPVLLAILLVTAIQLMPHRLPEAILPDAAADFDCQLSLVEEGTVTQTVTLTAEESAELRAGLQAARVQNRGQAGDITARHPLLYQLLFYPAEDGKVYEVFLDPEGRFFTNNKFYKIQGTKPQAIAETLQGYLDASASATGENTP